MQLGDEAANDLVQYAISYSLYWHCSLVEFKYTWRWKNLLDWANKQRGILLSTFQYSSVHIKLLCKCLCCYYDRKVWWPRIQKRNRKFV